jgi:hypothetical protein
MRTLRHAALAAALLTACPCLAAPARSGSSASAPAGIQWFATWAQAAKEARRTQRAILLIAAAPHCREISGMW